MREVSIDDMTLLKVYERQYSEDGKLKRKIVKVRGDIPVITSVSELYYMDLSPQEEKLLRDGRFGFESIPEDDIKSVKKKDLEKGAKRKEEIFKTILSDQPTKTASV